MQKENLSKKEDLKKASILRPILRIGKHGLSTECIREINEHLKKRKLIKIKLLKSFIKEQNKKDLANLIKNKTNSIIIKQIGNTLVLQKS